MDEWGGRDESIVSIGGQIDRDRLETPPRIGCLRQTQLNIREWRVD